jgi:hypothetical protein
MSKHNAYQFHIDREAPDYLVDQLERKIDELFCGHYKKKKYGFYAQDSPYAGAIFRENNPRYVNKREVINELDKPWVNNRWRLIQNDEIDYDVPPVKDAKPYKAAIKKCVHEWENDTSGSSGRKDITNQI